MKWTNEFIASLSTLAAEDVKKALKFLHRITTNPSVDGLRVERLDSTHNDDIYSARVTENLRCILKGTDKKSWLVLFVGSNECVRQWIEQRRFEEDSSAGELITTILEDTEGQSYHLPEEQPLFSAQSDDDLLSLGLNFDDIESLRRITSQEQLVELADRIPASVLERLFDIAEGKVVSINPSARRGRILNFPGTRHAGESASTVTMPGTAKAVRQSQPQADAAVACTGIAVFEESETAGAEVKPSVVMFSRRQRVHVLTNSNDLLRMLDAPREAWIAFLHPIQEELAKRTFSGPAKVTGTPGTGKTVLALHRSRHLSRDGKRVLLTTFSRTLCQNLDKNLRLICTPKEKAFIDVLSVHKLAREILKENDQPVAPCSDADIEALLNKYKEDFMIPLDASELLAEWRYVIQRHGITTWEEYQNAMRSGRGFVLGRGQRAHLWQLFQKVYDELKAQGKDDWPTIVRRARQLLESGHAKKRYDCIVVDEAQDLGAQELQFLAAMPRQSENGIMYIGDGGQRIYPGKVSLKDLGIDVRGRSHVLKLNYRMTEDIRTFADAILGDIGDDLDGEERPRKGVLSMLAGPEPVAEGFPDRESEMTFVAERIKVLAGTGMRMTDIAVFVRRNDLVESCAAALQKHGVTTRRLDEEKSTKIDAVALGTMHAAKGLEFQAVFVVDVSGGVVPPVGAVQKLKDAQAAQDFEQSERQLLYVSLTRARYHLYVCWVNNPSAFLTPPAAAVAKT